MELNNFGCHCCKNEHFSKETNFYYHNISDFERTDIKMFLFEKEVCQDQIDMISNNKSYKDYPNKEECVLKQSAMLKEVILIN